MSAADQLLAAVQAARSPDNNVRSSAEQFLQSLETTHTAAYFTGLSDILKDETKPDDIRQLSGLLLKNALSAEDDMLRMRRQGNWRSVHVSQRGTIKQALLTALASKSEGARTSAAQAIAKAGGIDVPAGEWPDLIQLLLGAAMNASLDSGVKAATLKCLGYLLEELPGDAVDVPTVNQVLTAIVDAMAPGRAKELVRAATVAMLAALDFAGESFSEERVAERNALMSSICSATQSDDVETRSGGFDCIIRVAELYYDSLGMYMNTLAQLTFAAARNAGDEATAVRAVEFWTTIAETEEELGPEDSGNNKYIVTALKALVEMLTGLMLTVGEDDGEDVYGPSQAAASCLGAVAKVAQDAVLDHVMPFVNSSFGSASWQAREAATLAMGVVMEGPDPAVVGGLINKALPAMLDRLTPGAPGRDPSVPVRDTTAWTIGHAFECLFDHLDMTSLFARTVTTLDAALDDEARVAQNAAYALHNIAAQCGYHVNEAGETPLTPHLMRLIGHLMARCDKDDWDESNLRTVCFETINMMVENVGEADHRVLGALLEEGARRLAASLGKPMMTADDKEEQGGLQVLLTAMLQTIAVELAEGVKPAADVLVGLLLRVFEGRLSAAAEEAYRALGAVASGCGADFAKYMPTVFPRLLQGIANTAEAQVCNAAIWAAAESCRALDAAVAPYAVPLVESLLAVLQSMEVHRSVKPPAIGALGDLALAVGPALEPHLGPIAQLLDQAARTPLPADADEDLAEYVGQLRLAVLEAWVGIFQGYNNEAAKPKGKNLIPLVAGILPRLEAWAREQNAIAKAHKEAMAKGDEDAPEPDMEISKAIAGLLGDIVPVVGKNHVPYKRSTDWVKSFLSMADRLEQDSWGDNRHDADGNKKESAAAYAKNLIPQL